MQSHQGSWLRACWVTTTVAFITVGVALGQGPEPTVKGTAKGKATDKVPKGGLRAPGGAPPKKLRRNVGDPFANVLGQGDLAGNPIWPFSYKFKLTSADGTPLGAIYYPAQRSAAPVVLLVHEKGRLGKDFEDGIEGLKDRGLADFLQSQGYAVLEVDLRGHGSNPRKEIGLRDSPLLVHDLQAAYQFLVDRHNREEINLAKFGVVALGEGANVVTAWAATPGGAVSSEGRISDLGALVLISPVAEGFGLRFGPALATVAPRIPVLLLAGERDAASLNPVKDAQPIVARQRQSKIEFFPTSLHGYKLLRFQPKVPEAIVAFFEATVKKLRLEDWEPRYNLTPVTFGEIELVRKKPGETKKALRKFEPEPKKEAPAEVKKEGDDAAKKEPAKGEEKAPGKDEEKKPAAKKS
jgi:dienelactone hydrolase